MQRDKVLVVALAIIIAVLLGLFFRGRAELKELRSEAHQIEKNNKKLQTENKKLKASLVQYMQVADSLNVAIGDLNTINDEVAGVVANYIAAFGIINSEIADIVAQTNEAIHASDSATTDDSLEPIIP